MVNVGEAIESFIDFPHIYHRALRATLAHPSRHPSTSIRPRSPPKRLKPTLPRPVCIRTLLHLHPLCRLVDDGRLLVQFDLDANKRDHDVWEYLHTLLEDSCCSLKDSDGLFAGVSGAIVATRLKGLCHPGWRGPIREDWQR